jgi:4-deoxy-L-threo-5-hexosulose-uronate ketol-isomerase
MSPRTLQATHPEMIKTQDTQSLRDLYLVNEIFQNDRVSLTYSHVERFVIGGAKPVNRALKLEPMRQGGRSTSYHRAQ